MIICRVCSPVLALAPVRFGAAQKRDGRWSARFTPRPSDPVRAVTGYMYYMCVYTYIYIMYQSISLSLYIYIYVCIYIYLLFISLSIYIYIYIYIRERERHTYVMLWSHHYSPPHPKDTAL